MRIITPLWMQPIFRPESRHLSEVSEIGCHQQRVMNNRGGGDFQILGSDADGVDEDHARLGFLPERR
jgi:hypothetical protein